MTERYVTSANWTYHVSVNISVVGPLCECVVVSESDLELCYVNVLVVCPLNYDPGDARVARKRNLQPSSCKTKNWAEAKLLNCFKIFSFNKSCKTSKKYFYVLPMLKIE